MARRTAAKLVRLGAEAALAAGAGAGLAAVCWKEPGQVRGIVLGAATAWVVSVMSSGALLAAKEVSSKAFWRTFGAGAAFRLAALGALMALSAREPGVSGSALLLTYVFGVLFLLILEYRHFELK